MLNVTYTAGVVTEISQAELIWNQNLYQIKSVLSDLEHIELGNERQYTAL